MFYNSTAMWRLVVAAGGAEIGEAEGEKGKINTAAHFFPAWQREGIYCEGNDDLCQGWKGRQGASGRRCAPIMINAPPPSRRQPSQHSFSLPPHTLSPPPNPQHETFTSVSRLQCQCLQTFARNCSRKLLTSLTFI